ncbi:hypothetical protein Tco_0658501 [Tanacetum coccineum]
MTWPMSYMKKCLYSANHDQCVFKNTLKVKFLVPLPEYGCKIPKDNKEIYARRKSSALRNQKEGIPTGHRPRSSSMTLIINVQNSEFKSTALDQSCSKAGLH